MTGKEKCILLKEIRTELAKNNGIIFVQAECSQSNGCIGTCPRCELEVEYLDKEIERIIKNGGKIIVPNTYFKLIKSFDVPAYGIKVEHEIDLIQNDSSSLLGDIAIQESSEVVEDEGCGCRSGDLYGNFK